MKPLSYSEMTLWYKDKNLYYQEYIEGKKTEPTLDMKIGMVVHQALERSMFEWQPTLQLLKMDKESIRNIRKILTKTFSFRLPLSEKRLLAPLQDGQEQIEIHGYLDSLDPKQRILNEYKTTRNPHRWHQWLVDEDEQLDFYALLFKKTYHRFLTNMRLFQLDISTGKVTMFETIRGPQDLKKIERKILSTVEQMKYERIWEKRLTREERGKKNQETLF